MPPDPKRGWRVSGDGDEAKRGWRKEVATTTPTRRKFSRTTKSLLMLLLFLGTVGLFIVVATRFLPPRPAHLVLVTAHYADNLAVPHNLPGWQASQALNTFAQQGHWKFLWWERGLFGSPKEVPFAAKSLLDWSEGLKSRSEDTLILYFAVHGAADSEGAYFIANDYNPYHTGEKRSSSGILRLTELLELLPREKNKLLILDATTVPASWPMGMIQNDFAAHLQQELTKRASQIPNLVVLSASDQGQRSWPSHTWRRSVFGHYVLLGLSGEADLDGNGRVTFAELSQYVRKWVEKWTLANRDELQTPYEFVSTDARPDRIDLVVAHQTKLAEVEPLDQKAANEKLQRVWADCDRLRESLPHPAIYSPHLLRQYLDTLVRYEQAVRIGAPAERVSALESALKDQLHKIDAGRVCELPAPQSALNVALPHFGIFGQQAPWKRDALRDRLGRFREAKTDEDRTDALKGISKWAADQGGAPERLLRLQICEALLDDFAQRSKGSLAELREVRASVEFLLQGGAVRPAEAHYLLMLTQDFPNLDPSPDLVRQAIGVRMLAERAALATVGDQLHPFAERVHPWITTRLVEADRERRLGEDWLFGDQAADHAKAKTHFDKASADYRKILDEAGQIRLALELHARVMSELPHYSLWLTRKRATPNPDKKVRRDEEDSARKQGSEVEALWALVHQLGQRLGQPHPASPASPPPDRPRDAKPLALSDLVKRVQEEFDKLTDQFDKHCLALTTARDQHQFWHALDSALAVPTIGGTLRAQLTNRGQGIATHYHGQYENDPEATGQLNQSEREARRDMQAEDAEFSARLQGRLAVAVLGEAWINRNAGERSRIETRERLLGRLAQPSRRGVWDESFARAGDQIGELWRRLPREIEQQMALIEHKRWLDKSNAKNYPVEVPRALADAAGLCGQLDGAAAGSLTSDPVQLNRRYALHTLLVDQAYRLWRDHWWYDHNDAKAEPHYLAASKACLDGAEGLATHEARDPGIRPLRLQAVKAARDELTASVIDAKPPASSMALTTELSFTASWQLERSKNVPADGVPMWRVVTKGPVESAPLKEGEPPPDLSFRRAMPNWSQEHVGVLLRSPPIIEEHSSPTLIPKRGKEMPHGLAKLELLYRGRKIDPEVRLDLYLGADTAAFQHPPPNNAGLAVRAEPNIQRGAIALVVDFSGSMDFELKGGRKKIEVAMEALKEVLPNLGDGTLLSVFVFGHRIGTEKIETAELTRVERIRPLTLWKRGQVGDLMAEFEKLKPLHLTPLVEAITKAKEDLLANPACRDLPKTIVMLTDGRDTRWGGDLGFNEAGEQKRAILVRQEVAKLFGRKELEDKRVTLNMVLFGDDDTERKYAHAQFKEALAALPRPGLWWDARDGKGLSTALYELLRPRLRLYQNQDTVPGMPPDGYKVFFPHENWDWSREFRPQPDHVYRAEIHGKLHQVSFARGDRLLINVEPGKGTDILLKRRLSVEEYERRKPEVRKPHLGGRDLEWLLAVHQNQHDQLPGKTSTGNALKMLATIENWVDVEPRDGILTQLKPGLKWFELVAGSEQPSGLRWHNVHDYPAPTWSLQVARWPRKGDDLLPPTLKAWWLEKDPTDEYVNLRHDPARDLKTEFQDIKQVQGVRMGIESITEELRQIRVDGLDPKLQRCLVVRLWHEPEKPIWVRLRDLANRNIEGEEHYFYREPGKVTAVFWPVVRVQEEPFTLHLHSIDALKNSPMRVEVPLRRPETGDAGPQKVQLLKP